MLVVGEFNVQFALRNLSREQKFLEIAIRMMILKRAKPKVGYACFSYALSSSGKNSGVILTPIGILIDLFIRPRGLLHLLYIDWHFLA